MSLRDEMVWVLDTLFCIATLLAIIGGATISLRLLHDERKEKERGPE